jgi:hypothetical protein
VKVNKGGRRTDFFDYSASARLSLRET